MCINFIPLISLAGVVVILPIVFGAQYSAVSICLVLVSAPVGYWGWRCVSGWQAKAAPTAASQAGSSEQTRRASSLFEQSAGGGVQLNCKIFRLEELERATQGFSREAEIGRGGFGTVFKGTLEDGTVVAVKRTRNPGEDDLQQFVNEVSILSQVNHRSLVKLLGCCLDLDVPLLVCEFVANGTLQDHLARSPPTLDWAKRFNIAIQTAEAIKYLHVQATPPIFHRDVKSANILLDGGFNAKVADFGISKLVDLDATHVSTAVKGTPGYLDPEYFHNFQLTDKSDVYSFGVVLLEIITARKPIDMQRTGLEQNLAVSSVPVVKSGKVEDILDERLSQSVTEKEIESIRAVAQVAVACLASERTTRPSMNQVLEMLLQIRGSSLRAQDFYDKADVFNWQAAVASKTQMLRVALGSSTEESSSSVVSSDATPVSPR